MMKKKLKQLFGGSRIGPQEERYDYVKNNQVQSIINFAHNKNRLYSANKILKLINNTIYDIVLDDYQNIHSFKQFLQYHHNFIIEPTHSGIITNKGPIAMETTLIRDKLNLFYDIGLVTLDSQPGLCYYETSNTHLNENHIIKNGITFEITIQRPYVKLVGKDELIRLIDISVTTHDFLAVVGNAKEADFSQFPNFNSDGIHYREILIGTRHKKDNEDISNYYELCFTSYFFDILINIAKACNNLLIKN